MAKTKLLYIEDEPFLGRIVKETLESQGYEILMLPDGKNAVETWKSFLPDVGILDVMLPHKNGYEIAQEIREIYPETPIIFLTAKTQTPDVLKGFEVGGNDYLKKPFSMEELIVRVENLLKLTKNKSTDAPKNLTIGDYELDVIRYELQHPQQVQKLSHREMELLQIFAEHTNQTVSRQKILLQIWNDDSFFNSRNLDVYVARLRQYLKRDQKIKIQTIRGVGYKILVAES